MMTGIFGGTFNPVHWGHVRTASEVKTALGLDTMLMVPCGLPPHRDQPKVSSTDRLAMLRLALEDFPELTIDERELNRDGPSYSVDTLESLHQEFPGDSFVLCVGADAFLHLDTWHLWKSLFRLAHVVVLHRPGWSLQNLHSEISSELQQEMNKRLVGRKSELEAKNAGLIIPLKVTDIEISSSDIRGRLANHESISGLVPVAVEAYIKRQELYQA